MRRREDWVFRSTASVADGAHLKWCAIRVTQDEDPMRWDALRLVLTDRRERDGAMGMGVGEGRLEVGSPREKRRMDLHARREIMKRGTRSEDARDALVVPRGRQRKDDVAEVLTATPQGMCHRDGSGSRLCAPTVG